MDEYLFVYGTLRKKMEDPMHRVLIFHARFIGLATFTGKLFDLNGHPAAVPDPSGGNKVIGEVYRVLFPERVFSILDRYEGCTNNDDPTAEFRRARNEVILSDGQPMEAWMYLYNLSTDHLPVIPGGDFLNR